MNILDDAPGALILVVLVILAFLCWVTLQGMYEAVNADRIALAIVAMVIAVLLFVVVLAGLLYLLNRLLD